MHIFFWKPIPLNQRCVKPPPPVKSKIAKNKTFGATLIDDTGEGVYIRQICHGYYVVDFENAPVVWEFQLLKNY